MNSAKVMLVAIWLQNNKDWDNTYKAILSTVAPDQFFMDEAKLKNILMLMVRKI